MKKDSEVTSNEIFFKEGKIEKLLSGEMKIINLSDLGLSPLNISSMICCSEREDN